MNNLPQKNHRGMPWHQTIKLAPHLFQVIEGGFVSFFILQGKKETILIDCGYGVTNTFEAFKEYFIGDVTVINTHIHPDHSNGNGYFATTCMHQLEWDTHALPWNANMYKIGQGTWNPSALLSATGLDRKLPKDFNPETYNQWVGKGIPVPNFVEEGEILDIGHFQLEIILTPAHTEGSISFLDHKNGYLFVGDAFCKDLKWLLNLKCRADLNTIFNTYEKLANRIADVQYILPSHGEVMISPSLITDIHEKMQQIKQGTLTPAYFTKKYVDPGYFFDFGGYGPVLSPEVMKR